MQIMNCGQYTISLFTDKPSRSIVYAVMDGEDAEAVWSMLKEPRPVLAAISGVVWNRELSPWPAPKALRGSDDFGGEAPAFLDALTGHMKEHLGFAPTSRVIAGYSLAGLFALWSVFTTDVFDRAASVSGSLWYDGFLEHIASSALHNGVEQIYLSLGDREKNARNPQLAAVEERTSQMAELLRSKGISVIFELNQGGHFDDVTGRITRAIDTLIRPAL